ncbi:phosphodiester glycosidase family protein [Streptomyces subrutilus]|uniref:phosphodiester glycosidase family protein n=1 Tax=Streptomyces subrutilus TaxID=36818 RepID=UPI002E0DA002|nr:phosphodiester glycosidase family protein [Streptomyces subrutilus]
MPTPRPPLPALSFRSAPPAPSVRTVRSARTVLAVALCALLAGAPAVDAAPGAGPPAVAGAAAAVDAGAAAAVGSGADDGIETARTGRQVAAGVRLESYDRLEADRWLRIDELVVDLGGTSDVRAEYLGGHGAATVAEAAARHPAGPGRRVVAAVNGDFFDIRGTGAPLGPGMRDGRLLHAATPGAGRAVGFGAAGAGRVLRIGLTGRVTLPGGAVRPLTGYNTVRPAAGGIAAYTADWAGAEIPVPVGAATAEVRDGRTTSAAPLRGPARPPRPAPGTTLLVAAGPAAAELAALRPGDPVAVDARPAPDAGPAPLTAVGGREPLVVAGVPQNHDGAPNDTSAPRTAVGFAGDGHRLRILTVDGRQRDSGGLTLSALGRLMHRNGARDALNLDGGGSTTLLAAISGAPAPVLENAPSDGALRPVANGLVLTAPAGPGRPAGVRVEALGGAVHVFPGLARTLTATAYDTALGPAPGAPRWSATAGRIGPDGVFRAPGDGPARAAGARDATAGAGRRGGVTASARVGTAQGALRLGVLGPLTRLRPVPERVGLAEAGESARFVLAGRDDQGAAAPVEPRDVDLRFDRSRWRVADDGRGGFTVTALVPRATGRLRATVRATGAATELALGVGLVTLPLADLSDAAAWTGRDTAPAEGHPGPGPGLELRAAGGTAVTATPPRPLPVPESTRALTLWARGDGSGARPAVELTDADGTALTLRGPAADWTGWRELTLPLPVTAQQPLTVTRLSAAGGGRPGRLLLDTLGARTPATGPAVPDAAGPDPLVATAAEVRARPWRFAVDPAGGPAAGADLVVTGAERLPFRYRGVRFVPLDTARRTLDGGGLERLRTLRRALAEAAREPATGALAVVRRHAEGTVDRKEEALTARYLAEFRRTTGKGAAVITIGAPRFAAGRSEGVLGLTTARGTRPLVGADAFPPPGRDWLAVHPPGRPGQGVS